MTSAGIPGRTLGTTSGKTAQAPASTDELRRSVGPRLRRRVPTN